MKSLVLAFFDGTLSTQRGSTCGVGTIIFSVLGYRVRDWFVITEAIRNHKSPPNSVKELAEKLDLLIGLDNLVKLEDAFHNNNLPLLDKIRVITRILP